MSVTRVSGDQRSERALGEVVPADRQGPVGGRLPLVLAPSVTGAARRLAAYLQSTGAHEIAELRLGKKTEELYAQAEKLASSSTATPTTRRQCGSPTRGRSGPRRRLADRVRARSSDHRRPPRSTATSSRAAQAHSRRARSEGRDGRQEKKTAGADTTPAEPVTVANVASHGVAERCGYVREGVMRSVHLKDDRRIDASLWSRLPSGPP